MRQYLGVKCHDVYKLKSLTEKKNEKRKEKVKMHTGKKSKLVNLIDGYILVLFFHFFCIV